MKIQNSLLDSLQKIKGIQGIEGGNLETEKSNPGGMSFGEMLINKYEEANNLGLEAEREIQKSLTGEDQNPHDAVIAVQKANISLTLMLGIKERLERAYQDLIKTQI